jgi:LruC domain-containing protein
MYRTATGGSQCPANTSAATIKLTINVNSTQLNANDLGAMPFDHYMFGTHKNDLYRYARKNSDSDWFAAWKQHYSSRDAANGPGPGKYLEIHLKEFSTGTNVFESDFSVSDYSGAVSVDAQNHAQGNPFITKQITRRGILTGNLPWVLDLPDNWKHPRENVDISIAYPNFFRWAEDNATFTDWYSSYVNQNKIYND